MFVRTDLCAFILGGLQSAPGDSRAFSARAAFTHTVDDKVSRGRHTGLSCAPCVHVPPRQPQLGSLRGRPVGSSVSMAALLPGRVPATAVIRAGVAVHGADGEHESRGSSQDPSSRESYHGRAAVLLQRFCPNIPANFLPASPADFKYTFKARVVPDLRLLGAASRLVRAASMAELTAANQYLLL